MDRIRALIATRFWAATMAACTIVATIGYSFAPFVYGSLAQRVLTPLFFPGLALSLAFTRNFHADPIGPAVVLGSAAVWTATIGVGRTLIRRLRRPIP